MSEVISQYGLLLLGMACLFSFFMAWGVGANDVANAMGTSVGAGAITIKQAIIIAMIFEFAGAWLAGGEVTSTIRSSIIDVETAGFDERPGASSVRNVVLPAGRWNLAFNCFKVWAASFNYSFYYWCHRRIRRSGHIFRFNHVGPNRFDRCKLGNLTTYCRNNFIFSFYDSAAPRPVHRQSICQC